VALELLDKVLLAAQALQTVRELDLLAVLAEEQVQLAVAALVRKLAVQVGQV
jgi:hypothetical protein